MKIQVIVVRRKLHEAIVTRTQTEAHTSLFNLVVITKFSKPMYWSQHNKFALLRTDSIFIHRKRNSDVKKKIQIQSKMKHKIQTVTQQLASSQLRMSDSSITANISTEI